MKHVRFASAVLAGAVALAGCADQPVPTAPSAVQAPDGPAFSQGAASTGRHLVVFRQESVPTDFAARVAALGGEVHMSFGTVGAATVEGLTPAAVKALRSGSDVSIVEPEILLELPVSVAAPEAVLAEISGHTPGNPADAHRFAQQWNLHTIGAAEAWAAGYTGSEDVTVAILDTGIDYTYPDLVGRVDLDRSVSFLPYDDYAVQYFFPGAHPIADLGYHGTHVAATVASNARVAAGVTSRTTLMGVKVCGTYTRGCPGAAIFAGIRHAVANGADVINMSLGGTFQKSDYPGYVSVLHRLFNEANRKNVTVVVSAGNSSIDMDHDGSGYKTYCSTPSTICVSATGPTAGGTFTTGPWTDVDAPAFYTNYGRSSIEVAAPGGSSGASVIAACSRFSKTIPVCQTGTYVVGLRGTSMASPHVSGLAALMVQKHGKNPAKVRAALQQSADDLGQPGVDPFYGKGRINMARAVGL